MLETAHSVCVRPSPRRWTRTAPKLNGGTVARRCGVFRPGALVASVASRWRGGFSGTPAASLSESGEAKQFPEQVGRQIIPIFPIRMVALPASKVPLQVFEARIDEGLVQDDSEMKGMGRIGICLSDDKGGMCSVGTLMRIEEHKVLDDGRMVVVLEGLQRFKVTKVMQKRPVLICEADMLPCDEDESSETVELADNVRQLFRDVIQLGRKMMKPGAASEIPSPVSTLSPCMLSFWLASYFPDSQAQQQQILEMDTTHERLLRLSTLLGDSVRYMSAATALQTALGGGSAAAAGGSDTGGTSGGPGGGPDSKN